MTGFRQRGMTLIELLISAFVVVVLISLVSGVGCNSCRSLTDRYVLKATVVQQPGSKYTYSSSKSGGSGSQKFSLSLKDIQVLNGTRPTEFAGAIGIVNCSSTQCASLREGNIVELSCYEEWNGFSQPQEEECRFEKLMGQEPVQVGDRKNDTPPKEHGNSDEGPLQGLGGN